METEAGGRERPRPNALSATVAICTHNRAALLGETLTTLAHAGRRHAGPVEVLVVEDHCTDGTCERVQVFAQAHPDIELRLLRSPTPGLSHARNTALAAARGEVICFLDDDVLVPEAWLDELLSGLSLGANVGAVAGRVQLLWPSQPRPRWLEERHESLLSKWEWGEKSCLLPFPGFVGCNFALRREAAASVGQFTTNLGRVGACLLSGEDIDYASRLAQAGYAIAYSATGYVYHRVMPERMTLGWLLRRSFWGGASEYLVSARERLSPQWLQPWYPLFRLRKLIWSSLRALLAPLAFSRKRLVRAWLRQAKVLGLLYGWWLERRGRG